MNRIILIESPYRNGDRNRNLRYLAWCEFHASSLGEVPIASHGNCTAYVPEDDEHRAKGFAWRDRVRGACDYVVFYTDLGMSEGQQLAELRDADMGIECKRRALPPELLAKFEAGEHPPGSMRRVVFAQAGVSRKPSDRRTSARLDGWTKYRVVDKDGERGMPILHESWNDAGILLELEARGYLPFHAAKYTLVHDGEQLRVERDGLVLTLTPVEC